MQRGASSLINAISEGGEDEAADGMRKMAGALAGLDGGGSMLAMARAMRNINDGNRTVIDELLAPGKPGALGRGSEPGAAGQRDSGVAGEDGGMGH